MIVLEVRDELLDLGTTACLVPAEFAAGDGGDGLDQPGVDRAGDRERRAAQDQVAEPHHVFLLREEGDLRGGQFGADAERPVVGALARRTP